jgi:hypothetical protein
MRLENQPPASSGKFTQDELSELLSSAISRHGDASRRAEQFSTLASMDDALEIARSLGIPEEHVHEAARELQRRQFRGKRREQVRAKRRAAFLASIFLMIPIAGIASLMLGRITAAVAVVMLLLCALPVLLTAWRWLAAPVTDEEADREELPATAGACRVCGRPSYAANATFCEEHRYRPQ